MYLEQEAAREKRAAGEDGEAPLYNHAQTDKKSARLPVRVEDDKDRKGQIESVRPASDAGQRAHTALVKRQGYSELMAQDSMMKGALVYGTGILMGGLTFLSGAGPVALAMGGCLSAIGGAVGARSFRSFKVNNYQLNILALKKKIRLDFKDAQIKAYEENKEEFLALADQQLAAGGLLDEEALSYLVRYDSAALQEASDQLAITVLQARQALTYIRGLEQRTEEPSEAVKPLGFKDLHLDPRHQAHCSMLRRQLTDNDTPLPEDSQPVLFTEPDLTSLEQMEKEIERQAQLSTKDWCLRAVAMPFFMAKDIRMFEAIENDLKKQNILPDEAPVPALRPVDDFKAALSFYEKNNEPLDLPALRGWKPGTNRHLPKTAPSALRNLPR